MKNKPILFSCPMVRAILEGRKTQTRRIMNPQPKYLTGTGKRVYETKDFKKSWEDIKGTGEGSGNPDCKFGNIGDQMWVRETWAQGSDLLSDYPSWLYRADKTARLHGYDKPGSELITYGLSWDHVKWKPSIFMPKDASRILLEITNIRCELLQDISEEDALAEGIESLPGPNEYKPLYPLYGTKSKFVNDRYTLDPKMSYVHLWESINGPESWKENPWVWVIEFKVLEPCR